MSGESSDSSMYALGSVRTGPLHHFEAMPNNPSPPTDRHADVIGIDLGTTNCAVAWASGEAIAAGRVSIRAFDVPQLVREGEIAPDSVLPSFLYFVLGVEAAPGSFDLPWVEEGASDSPRIVGALARELGARTQGRSVSSAKSWLCHARVDRRARILPWGDRGDARISPVEASAAYLRQIRLAWNHLHGGADRERRAECQDVVITVPASFDEAARELTVEAAREAGFEHIVLLEEPQAALYAWIDRLGAEWSTVVEPGQTILVIDIGGGTTDLSLIRVGESAKGARTLERFAVGRHLMLGGDNMDLALAHVVERRMGAPSLDAARWQSLTQGCRAAKEQLLRRGGPERVPVQVLGIGSGVVGGTMSAELTRADVNEVLLDGFLPLVGADASPDEGRGSGLQELGLPYESDAAITRHLSDFLARSSEGSELLRVDAVLFNGGALKGVGVRKRVVRQLRQWAEEGGGSAPVLLEGAPLDLAVARGAAYYGVVRRGLGVRIGGGSARAYYVQVARDETAVESNEVKALCVAPMGLEEGESVRIEGHDFLVRANRPVSFQLMGSTAREGDRGGDLVEVERASMEPLPPILTVLRFGKPGAHREIPIRLASRLTEVGTLELWCESVETEHRWRLDMQVRGALGGGPSSGSDPMAPGDAEQLSQQVLERAAGLARAALAPDDNPAEYLDLPEMPTADNLAKLLPMTLGQERQEWSLSTARHLWTELFELRGRRDAAEAIEARWLNLVGYCLRPGFGYALDDWRINELWKLFHAGTRWPRSDRCRAEWWTMWRRASGGMSVGQQNHALAGMEKQLAVSKPGPAKKRRRGKGTVALSAKKLAPRERIELLMAAASFERVDAGRKERLAEHVLGPVANGNAGRQELWVLSRVGARRPLYGPANLVVPPERVLPWIDALLESERPAKGAVADALVSLGRRTGDRARDIADEARGRIRGRLESDGASPHQVETLDEPSALDGDDAAALFGESLPPGLVLAGRQQAPETD